METIRLFSIACVSVGIEFSSDGVHRLPEELCHSQQTEWISQIEEESIKYDLASLTSLAISSAVS